jgi:beta-lactamase class A
VLARIDRGEEQLDRRIYFTDHDLVAPYKGTKPYVGDSGMTIVQLCEVAITVSDSTAANSLLASFGGPAALTAFLRSLGDLVTRIDGTEPNVNIVKPGDVHDTTTPGAMVATLYRLLVGDALSSASRSRLTTWMIDARDAATQRLRLGLPKDWRIANKPGTWEAISTNDIGVIWPPNRNPLVVAVYLGEAPGSLKKQEGILADVARIIADNL